MQKMKDNFCEVSFLCGEAAEEECVYYKKRDADDRCKYSDCGLCHSAVARVNRLTLELNSIMGRREDALGA